MARDGQRAVKGNKGADAENKTKEKRDLKQIYTADDDDDITLPVQPVLNAQAELDSMDAADDDPVVGPLSSFLGEKRP